MQNVLKDLKKQSGSEVAHDSTPKVQYLQKDTSVAVHA